MFKLYVSRRQLQLVLNQSDIKNITYLASNVNFRLQEQRNSVRAVWTSQLCSCNQKLICLKKISLKQFNLKMKISLVKYILFISCVCFLLVIPPCDSPAVTFSFIVVYILAMWFIKERNFFVGKSSIVFSMLFEIDCQSGQSRYNCQWLFSVWSFDVISIFKASNIYNSSKTSPHHTKTVLEIWSLHLMGGSIMNDVFGAYREQN